MEKQKIAEKSVKLGMRIERQAKLFDAEKKDNIIYLSISSETPVSRWYPIDGEFREIEEILDHSSEENVDLEKLNNIFIDHNTSVQNIVGSVKTKSLDVKSRKVRVGIELVKDDPLSDRISKLLEQKHLSTVSIGYELVDILGKEEDEESGRLRVKFSFRIYEASFVGVPADSNVGIGRDKDKEPSQIKPINKINNNTKGKKMTTETNVAVNSVDIAEKQSNIDLAVKTEQSKAKKRLDDILAIRESGKAYNLGELAEECIAKGRSLDDFHKSAIERLQSKPGDKINIHKDVELSKKEQDSYSISKAIRYLDGRVNNSATQMKSNSGIHIDIHQELLKKHGSPSDVSGLLVPECIRAKRAERVDYMSVNAGSNLTNTAASLSQDEYRPQDLQTILRNNVIFEQLGAITLNGVTSQLVFPKQTAGTTLSWETAENQNAGATSATYSNETVGMKTISGYVPMTRQLIFLSDPSIDTLIISDLGFAMADTINTAFFNGAGSNLTSLDHPVGIMNNSGINNIAAATNGDALTYDMLVDFDGEIANNNFRNYNPRWITNSKVISKLKKTVIESGTTAERILGKKDVELLGDPFLRTNSIPNNLTKGTGSNLSAIIYGDFGAGGASTIITNFGSLELDVDRTTNVLSGAVNIIIRKSTNVFFRRPNAISVKKDVVTV
tara:strand:- start:5424 stop:7436 length:2013 start_codon:yes stop_codon:yes gene_type:complete